MSADLTLGDEGRSRPLYYGGRIQTDPMDDPWTKHDNVQIQLDFHAHGAVAAVDQVLPEMLARGSGTILFTTGATSVRPELGHDMFGNVAPAAAWLRNWAHGLHAAAAPRGVQVGHIAIGAWLGRQPGATAPEEIAPLYWELHTQHDQVEKVFFPSDQTRSE